MNTRLFKGITQEKYDDWITPAKAVDDLAAVFGTNSNKLIAKQTLLEALRAGQVRAVAETASENHGSYTAKLADMPAPHWMNIDTNEMVWTTGHVTYRYADDTIRSGLTTVSRFGVRLNPDDVQKLLPPTPKTDAPQPSEPTQEQPQIPSNQNKGGRPRKEWWDDFWIAICHQLHTGKLQPKLQADLESAMLDWAEKHGHKLGETSARNAAQKLLKTWPI